MQPPYTLANVEQRFGCELDPRPLREGLALHTLVKLIFVPLHPDPDACGGERMWVIVRERLSDGNYRGELNNDPIVGGARLGDAVTFGPEHILAIYPHSTSH